MYGYEINQMYLSAADDLLIHADAIRGLGIVDPSGFKGDVGQLASKILIGMALRKRPALCLRALVEEWDMQRIIRELY